MLLLLSLPWSSYCTLIRSKLECASVVWNSITSSDTNKLESIYEKIYALCFTCYFPHVHYSYVYALGQFKLHTLWKGKYHLDALVLFQVYLGFNFCSSILDTLGLSISALRVRDYVLFNICPLPKNYPLLDELQLMMLFAVTLKYLESKPFSFLLWWYFLPIKI
jgi:hypothetical protein